MTQFIDRTGTAQEVNLTVQDYQIAFKQGLTLPQYYNRIFPTNAEKHGTAFEQFMASNDLFLTRDRRTGIRPPTIQDVLEGGHEVNLGAVIRPDGSGAQTVSGRLLFPAVVLEMVESELQTDYTSYQGVFNRMLATTTNVDSPRADQPIINLTAPQGSRSQEISQLAEPARMASITLSEKSYKLPTVSIMLQISAEALRASTLDLVGIAIREQGIAERAAIIDEGLDAMINGDTDLGMTALTPVSIDTIDPSLTANGTMSHKGWVKWLREDWQKLAIDWVICDIDAFLAIEGRSGRPVLSGDRGTDERLNSIPTAANPGIPDVVNFFIVSNPAIVAANEVVGIDSRRAIRKVVYTGAQYAAVEEFVLRKSTAFRFDFSESYFRLIDGAWKMLTLTAS